MKINYLSVTATIAAACLLFSSSLWANDYPEAAATVLNELVRPQIDSSQIELGGGLSYHESTMEPSANVKSKLFFKQKYSFGFSGNFHTNSTEDRDFLVYAGLTFGVRGFQRGIGKYYFDTLLAYGETNQYQRIVIEPSIILPLSESGPVKYFWLRHRFGLNAAIAYRHAIDPDDTGKFDDLNAIKFYLTLFINQKGIN